MPRMGQYLLPDGRYPIVPPELLDDDGAAGPRRMTPTRMHSLIAMALAAMMPLCCCQVHILSMLLSDGTSAESISAVERSVSTPACCAQKHSAGTSDAPCGDDGGEPMGCAGCCVKFAAASLDWSPPIDQIGSDLPAWLLPSEEIAVASASVAPELPAWDASAQPPPELRTLYAQHCALLI